MKARKRTTSKKKSMKARKTSSRSKSMDKTLHLTKEEQQILEKLPSSLLEGWKIKRDTATEGSKDNPERMKVRFSLIANKHPLLKSFAKKMETMSTPEDFTDFVNGVDASSLSGPQWSQFFMALGPVGLTLLVDEALRGAKTSNDIEDLATLSEIRSTLSVSHSLSLASHV